MISRTSLFAAALAFACLLSACGSSAPSDPACKIPPAPQVAYRDCKAGESPTLRAQEWACHSSTGIAYSYVRFEYVPQGYTLLFANGVDLVSATGVDIPYCYRGTSTLPTPSEKCTSVQTWVRCGTSPISG